MAVIPTLLAFVAGEKVTATKLTAQTKTAIERSVYYKPFCSLSMIGAQSIGSSSSTLVNLDTIDEDTDAMADLSAHRIIIKTAGLYRITAQVSFATNATGARGALVNRNGATITSATSTVSGDNARCNASRTIRLAVNDLITVNGWQTSGGSLALLTTFGGCFLQAEWVSL